MFWLINGRSNLLSNTPRYILAEPYFPSLVIFALSMFTTFRQLLMELNAKIINIIAILTIFPAFLHRFPTSLSDKKIR